MSDDKPNCRDCMYRAQDSAARHVCVFNPPTLAPNAHGDYRPEYPRTTTPYWCSHHTPIPAPCRHEKATEALYAGLRKAATILEYGLDAGGRPLTTDTPQTRINAAQDVIGATLARHHRANQPTPEDL